MIHNEEQIVKQIKDLSIMLGGEVSQCTTGNSMRRQSKKIVIEYDIQEQKNA